MSLAIFSLLVLLTGSMAGIVGDSQWISAETLRQTIEQRLASRSIGGVTVAVSDRNVTLTGTVSSLWEKTQAREEAWNANTQGAVFDEVVVARSKSDAELVDLVGRRIRHFVFFTIFDDVAFTVDDGIVELTGTATTFSKAEAFAEFASHIPGVQDVINCVQWPPASPFDVQLREAIAVRIYRDALFWNQAFADPAPVHILVSGGHVTLTGTVHSDAERQAAERIAVETLGVRSFENKLRVDGEW